MIPEHKTAIVVEPIVLDLPSEIFAVIHAYFPGISFPKLQCKQEENFVELTAKRFSEELGVSCSGKKYEDGYLEIYFKIQKGKDCIDSKRILTTLREYSWVVPNVLAYVTGKLGDKYRWGDFFDLEIK